MRVATKTISGALRRRDDARARSALDPDRGRARSSKSPSTRSSRRACCRRTSTRKSATRRSTRSRSRSRPRTRSGSSTSASPSFVAQQRAQARTTRIEPERDREFEYFGLRTVYDRYLLKHPRDAPRDRDAAAVLPAHRLRARSRPCARRSSSIALFSSLEYLPSSPTLFNAGTRHEQLSSCFLLDSPDDHLETHLPALHRRRDALEVLGRHRARLPPRALARLADRGHQRPLERHRALAQDARRVGGGGESGRQAQGRLLRVPRALARRHRGVPRAARQHRRRGAPHAQPEPRRTGCRTCSCARVEADGTVEPVRSRRTVPDLPDLYGDEFDAALRRRRSRRAARQDRRRRASSTRA